MTTREHATQMTVRLRICALMEKSICYAAGSDSITVTESYADCVKDSGDYFSIQNMVRSATGDRWGNGFVAGALLGNWVSDYIDIAQSAAGGDWNDGPHRRQNKA